MAQDAEQPQGDGITRFSYCPSHIAIEDGMSELKDDIKSLEQRFGDLVIEQTKLTGQLTNNESRTAGLIDELQKDREDRKTERKEEAETREAERRLEAEEREKDRQAMQKNIEFYQALVTCNNKASIEERKELIKYGGKVVLILLVAVCGIKIVTAALGIPFP